MTGSDDDPSGAGAPPGIGPAVSNGTLSVNTLIVGNGPSALILSYLLHGNTPYYNPETEHGPHPDPVLHGLLENSAPGDAWPARCIYDCVLHNLTLQYYLTRAHREFASDIVAPVNYLLDTLDAPNLDLDVRARSKSRIGWRVDETNAVSHLVVGSSFVPGGQWAGREVPSRTLSYAEMLSLPGFSFSEFYRARHGKDIDGYSRPMRADVAAYYASYPARVGIADSVYTNYTVLSLRRSGIAAPAGSNKSFNAIIQNNDTGRLQLVTAKNVVLATGVFTHQVPPDPILHPIVARQCIAHAAGNDNPDDGAVLIIGSGFSAADAILSVPEHRQIIHLFRWDPKNKPSPLRACHRESYPEYARLYRLMRLAAAGKRVAGRDGGDIAARYEGFPNCEIVEATADSIKIALPSGAVVDRQVAELKSYVGRIGVISYLSSDLRAEIGVGSDQIWASKHSLSERIASRIDRWTTVGSDQLRSRTGYECNLKENFYSISASPIQIDDIGATSGAREEYAASYGLEVADGVFVIGSLVGDSLVRYALGGCVTVAGNIIERQRLWETRRVA